ncbi:MAG TPA: phosphotransferase family protein [Candidatus Acidoferrales bacterium]|nr:phosphotransferase family protein [Candidatus Acidoferrales bacterium]
MTSLADLCDRSTAVRKGEELDLPKLERFLDRHFPGDRRPLVVEQYPSGHSNLTYLVRMGEREFVLRRPPFGSKVKTAHDMGREFRVLSKLHAAYAPAPEVLLFCEDDSILGAPFYLMKPIHGIIIRRDPPAGLPFDAQTARRVSESFIDNLAVLHSLDYEAVGLGDLGKPQGYVERQVRGWVERYYGSRTHDLPEVARIASWMQGHLPTTGDAALIHNDYKYDNVVLAPNDITRIIGVLDWEMTTVGDPLADLGTTLAYWVDANDPEDLQDIRWCPSTYPGSMTRAELVERYARKTGRDLSGISFYLVLARFKLAVIVQQIYYRYHQGLTKDQRFAEMPDVVRVLLRAALASLESGEV